MATAIGPSIDNSGLIISLDANNIRSFTPGTTTWNDLVYNANFELINGATYSNGVMLFDGVDDYADGGISGGDVIGATSTISCWVKFNGLNIFAGLISKDQSPFQFSLRLDISYTKIELVADNDNVSILTNNIEINRWYYVTAVVQAGGNKLYLDGELVGSDPGGFTLATNNKLYIGTDYDTTRLLNGYLGLITVHNKELTASQIKSNYTKQKHRFVN